ncbi:hypothetical protein [Caulobacter segnis]|uniref:DUF2975 domain-containing protein n=1 Tax=Caulobacter segnis TaxID=88688 RepID=A0A2W5WN33_9CAUL|nr:hypothetical protein [Caulobacter segnis]PZR35408.1 MAG: hypothetical protein DI526_07435 [Caulobacter segnis]
MGEKAEGRWLRRVSGAMALFTGIVATALTLAVVVSLIGSAISGWRARPVAWAVGGKTASVSAEFDSTRQKSCTPGARALCPSSGPPDIKGYVSGQLGAAVLQLPLAVLAYGLLQACGCFFELARGRMLARRTVDGLVRFSMAGLTFVVLSPFAGGLAALVADGARKVMDLATGDSSVFFSVSVFSASYAGATGLLTVIYAVTLTVIAVVMVKASTIADDHAQIV